MVVRGEKMIRYLIKNNIKLLLRNKWVMVVMILSPIFVIMVLSSAFEDLMKSYEGVETFKAGYFVEESGQFAGSMEQIKEAGKQAGISFVEYTDGKAEDIMEENELSVFVEFGKKEYIIYESTDCKTEGIVLEYFLSRLMDSALAGQTASGVELPVQELSFMPAIDSKDYYGIIYVVYFIWVSLVCISGVLSSERKNGILKKFRVSPMSEMGLFLSKWIPCIAVTIGTMTITILVCIGLFDIAWGNIPWSILILLLAIFAAISFGLFLYYLFDNLAVTIVGLFTIVWFMGFAGGSFETYMFSSCPEWIKHLSPIYYINRTLVEYSCMGKSDYTMPCILYMIVLTVICTAGALLIGRMRRGKSS